MRTSRTARKAVGAVSAIAVSLLLLGGTAATLTSDDAGRGIASVNFGRGI